MKRVLFLMVIAMSLVSGQVYAASKYDLQQAKTHNAHISGNDKHLIEHLVEAEARNEPYVTQVSVASVILNRLENPKFPNDVASVIFQPNEFPSVSNEDNWSSTVNVSDTVKKAVDEALSGWDPTGNALYFYKTDVKDTKLQRIKKIGNLTFYRK